MQPQIHRCSDYGYLISPHLRECEIGREGGRERERERERGGGGESLTPTFKRLAQ